LELLALVSLLPAAAGMVSFVAVGDWGSDSAGQRAVAAGMDAVAAAINASFAVLLGFMLELARARACRPRSIRCMVYRIYAQYPFW
jgi:hypothetical protein